MYLIHHCNPQLLKLSTGTPHLIVLSFLHFADIAFFYKLKVCSNPVWSKSIGTIFSNNICSLHVSVSHFGNSPNISNFFIIIIFIIVICDQ